MGVSLLDGALPWALLVLGTAGGVFLLARRESWWWRRVVPGTVVASAVLAWIVGNTVAKSLIGQDLTFSDQFWIGVALAGIILAIASLFGTPWWRKAVAILAGLLVVAMAGNQINRSYLQYPRLGDLFGPTTSEDVLPARSTAASSAALPTAPLTQAWTPTGANIPSDGGKVTTIALPGTTSGFQPRESYVYLPPAYFADNPQPLPVLMLFHGVPGGPGDWNLGDRVKGVMDAYAAEHDGIAPVVVMPDATGGQVDNPLCTDSNLGKVGTYLSVDVPAAVRSQLLVDPHPEHWAVGGFSYGGTCAFQLATRYPDLFPSFLDFAGEEEPSLGSRADTVQKAFDGDTAKFKAINPLDLLAANKYPNSGGWFIVGADDSVMMPGVKKLYAAAQAAGMDVQYWEVPGLGHDWGVPVAGLTHAMPWLGQRMGITGPDAAASSGPSTPSTASPTPSTGSAAPPPAPTGPTPTS
ncbi:alpha/beta hydrolase-fold protein [Nakamurella sp.]|uniref:alpha/beta hydrolase-fold protein n=1 Tax=Nakamurella sp. TaxID=1869182 RepID=UPI003B3B8B2D